MSGSDLCDMSGAKGRIPYEFTVYNVMKPRTYYKEWQGNLYEKRCKARSMATQYYTFLSHQKC